MPTFITTGKYSTEAMRGMMAQPSDREAATRRLIEASGGKMIAWYLTTGAGDFMVISEAPNGTDIIPALIASGASGAVSDLRTVMAYGGAEFMAAQKKANDVAKAYASPA